MTDYKTLKIILASKSKARKFLFENAKVEIDEFIDSNIDEAEIKANNKNKSSFAIAVMLADSKAHIVSKEKVGAYVIGGDQTLELSTGEMLSKSKNIAELKSKLLEMRGDFHFLHSAVSLYRNGQKLQSCAKTAKLYVRDFSDAWLESYIDKEGTNVLNSVGGYHMENIGIQLFDKIEGDYFTVLGIPLIEFMSILRKEGIVKK